MSEYVFGKSVALEHAKARERVIEVLGNPQFAHRALQAEPSIGALLPCNVVVRVDDAGSTRVEIMDPHAVLQLVGRPEIGAIAGEVRSRLQRVLQAL